MAKFIKYVKQYAFAFQNYYSSICCCIPEEFSLLKRVYCTVYTRLLAVKIIYKYLYTCIGIMIIRLIYKNNMFIASLLPKKIYLGLK